jgi:hypothetical protein
MCGGDMYKEDRREVRGEGALGAGLAALVGGCPGTGQTTFPHRRPNRSSPWQAALDELAKRPEIDGERLGRVRLSRGRAVGHASCRARCTRESANLVRTPAAWATGGTDEERAALRKHVDERSKHWFGPVRAVRRQKKIAKRISAGFPALVSDRTMGFWTSSRCRCFSVNGKQGPPHADRQLCISRSRAGRRRAASRACIRRWAYRREERARVGPAAWKWLGEQLTR